MHILPPTPSQLNLLQQFLQRHDLPDTDLTAAQMPDFLLAWDGPYLAAAGGLEIYGETALLRSLVVDEDYRGRGLGAHMVHRLEEHAGLRRVRTIYLLTTTAERFFTSLGYARTPRESAPAVLQATAEFQSLCPDTAVCMSRSLLSA
jgi:amino-acid N-acetyltransferase